MRFGISATSSIFPKNFRTRFRPINVCAIMSSRSIETRRRARSGPEPPRPDRRGPGFRGDQGDSPEGRNPSRPSGQASDRRASQVLSRPDRTARDIVSVLLELPGFRCARPAFPEIGSRLLQLNLGAGLFEGGLDLGGLVLVDAVLDRLRSALDQVLGFL